MVKFNIQDRIVLDEMVDTFKNQVKKQHKAYDSENKKPIITEKYWFQMIDEVQQKIDNFTTKKALKDSRKYR
jgi:hypothetical protein